MFYRLKRLLSAISCDEVSKYLHLFFAFTVHFHICTNDQHPSQQISRLYIRIYEQ